MEISENIQQVGRLGSNSTRDVSDAVMCCRFTPDGKYVAQGRSNGQLLVFECCGNGSPLVSYTPFGVGERDVPMTSLRFSPFPGPEAMAYRTLVTSSSGDVREFIINLATRGIESTFSATESGNEVLCCDYSLDGRSIVTGGSDMVLRVYDVDAERAGLTLQIMPDGVDDHGRETARHTNRIFSLKYCEPHMFLSAGWGSSMMLFDTRRGSAPVQLYPGVRVSGDSIDVCEGNIVVGNHRDEKQIQVFDMRTSIPVVPDMILSSQLYGLRCTGRKSKLRAWACGADPNQILLVDVLNSKVEATVKGVPEAMFSVDVCPTNGNLAVAGGARFATYLLTVISNADRV